MRGTSWDPCNKDSIFGGLHWGPSIYGNYHLKLVMIESNVVAVGASGGVIVHIKSLDVQTPKAI